MSCLRVVSSGSSGNAYILDCDGEVLLIELGVKFELIRKCLEGDISKVQAAIVTHQHSDHAGYIPQAQKYGIPVFSCESVASKYERVSIIKKGKRTTFGNFSVQPFHVSHSVECYSFLITHPKIGKMWFITDCKEFPITKEHISGVNHIFIECNYSSDIVLERMCDTNKMNESMSEYHMEINDTVTALKANYSSDLMTIGLIHLSDTNSNEKEFLDRVTLELGFINTFVCASNMEIPLELSEF